MPGPAELDMALSAIIPSGGEPRSEEFSRLSRIRYVSGKTRMPNDPFSPDYMARQKDLYLEVSGCAGYDFGNEATSFDFDTQKDDFFPYNTKSPDYVGEQLLKQGFLIKHMRLQPGSRIVEFGAGWGNTTVQMAMMGYDVTAVEVNPASIRLIRHRAASHGREIRIADRDMVSFARESDQRFDAALFVASFHHCDDHLVLLRHLSRLLSENGRIYFADEPILPAWSPILPYPWGLRLDGPSLFYIRRYGWLELGFRENYLREALRREGWSLSRIPSPVPEVPDLYVASRS